MTRTAADITADPKPVPWSRRQLQQAMRDAGWKWLGIGWYEHTETGARFDFETWHEGDNRPVWRVWAEKRETPPK